MINKYSSQPQNHDDKKSIFGQFNQWSNILELLIAGNLMAVIMAIASIPTLTNFSWLIVLPYMLFVSWVVIVFLLFLNHTQAFLNRQHKTVAIVFSFMVLLLIIFLTNSVVNSISYIHQHEWSNLTAKNIFRDGLHRMVLGAGLAVLCLRYLYIREQAILRRQAELMAKVQALQARIHPHFLFNSLNSVVSLITIDPFKAEKMLIDLSRLFRASLQEMKEVSLEEEVQLCKRYLAIESIRLGERLCVEWRIDSNQDLKEIKIPLLTLQPLLENCIYHGVETLSETSKITILIDVKNRDVNIVITNPYQDNNKSTQGNGIAIENVKQRLLVYYGKNTSFKSYAQYGKFMTLIYYRY